MDDVLVWCFNHFDININRKSFYFNYKYLFCNIGI